MSSKDTFGAVDADPNAWRWRFLNLAEDELVIDVCDRNVRVTLQTPAKCAWKERNLAHIFEPKAS